MAFADTVADETDVGGRRLVDLATVFVSHPWNMAVKEFFEVCIAELGDGDYSWIDNFMYAQFGEGDGSTEAWIGRFDSMITGIGKVVRI